MISSIAYTASGAFLNLGGMWQYMDPPSTFIGSDQDTALQLRE